MVFNCIHAYAKQSHYYLLYSMFSIFLTSFHLEFEEFIHGWHEVNISLKFFKIDVYELKLTCGTQSKAQSFYTANPFPVQITGISLCSNSTL